VTGQIEDSEWNRRMQFAYPEFVEGYPNEDL